MLILPTSVVESPGFGSAYVPHTTYMLHNYNEWNFYISFGLHYVLLKVRSEVSHVIYDARGVVKLSI